MSTFSAIVLACASTKSCTRLARCRASSAVSRVVLVETTGEAQQQARRARDIVDVQASAIKDDVDIPGNQRLKPLLERRREGRGCSLSVCVTADTTLCGNRVDMVNPLNLSSEVE